MFEKALDDWIRPNTFAGYSQSQNVNLVNLKEKKKPHNIQIDNNRREPTVKANIKYSEKQNFRKYKTKTEPKLHSKILINEEDDIIGKIREAFGLEGKKPNTNYAEVETAPAGSMITNVEEQPVLSTVFGSGTRPKQQRERKLQDYSVDDIWNLDNESTAKLFRNNLAGSEHFRQLYEEQAKLRQRDLNEDELTAIAKITLSKVIEQRHSIDDIDPKDQEDLTGMAAGGGVSPTSPARPHGSAIVQFPVPGRLSMSDVRGDFFTAASGIIPEDQLTALHRLKPIDKVKICQFSPKDVKNFTIDEIINSTVGELKGLLKVKAAKHISRYIKKDNAQMAVINLHQNYNTAQDRLAAAYLKNKDAPQKSYRDILNEKHGEAERQQKIDGWIQEMKRNTGSMSSSALSEALTELEKKRGRPVGAYGIVRRQKQGFKTISQGKRTTGDAPSHKTMINNFAALGWK